MRPGSDWQNPLGIGQKDRCVVSVCCRLADDFVQLAIAAEPERVESRAASKCCRASFVSPRASKLALAESKFRIRFVNAVCLPEGYCGLLKIAGVLGGAAELVKSLPTPIVRCRQTGPMAEARAQVFQVDGNGAQRRRCHAAVSPWPDDIRKVVFRSGDRRRSCGSSAWTCWPRNWVIPPQTVSSREFFGPSDWPHPEIVRCGGL